MILRFLQEPDVAVIRPRVIHGPVLPTDQGRSAQTGNFRELCLRHPVALSDAANPERRQDTEMLADRFELDSLGFAVEEFEATHSTSPYGKVDGQVGRRSQPDP